MTRWAKGLIGVVLLLAAAMLVRGVLFVHAFIQPPTFEERPAACAAAMKSIGWELPSGADGGGCTEIVSNVFESGWSGEFRMPRRDVHDWFVSLRGTSVQARGGDQLHWTIVPPSQGRIDFVDIKVRWEDDERAVVRFETYNG
ncbi:hypothetical protein CG740_14175 [Streptomyces sp. CB01201]|uniref:hypothetical protein n=1 Tax=unclassified Streptomyces TaxID=2593676 RepID=UPI000C27AF96|nr:hypothetical protein [Streptomyces sp. CB01201]PJN02206.1 hypothetical protein CG740_14175 [Streptomyces sp. CB01201]